MSTKANTSKMQKNSQNIPSEEKNLSIKNKKTQKCSKNNKKMPKKSKKEPRKRKIIYYEDELNDDFAGTNIKSKRITAKFKYIHKNPIWRFFAFLIFYVIAVPVIGFYCFFIKKIRFVVNKKELRKARKASKTGLFFYGNHTGIVDVFTPYIISLPRRSKILASPDAVSVKGLSTLVQMFGGMPVPQSGDIAVLKKCNYAIEYYSKKFNIAIYPEAHIWPYYTGVRNFKDSSFSYPVKMNAPVVAMFTAYSEPKGKLKKFKKPRATVYVSDPIFPDQNKPRKEAQKELRDKVYAFMKDCSEKYSTFDYIEYKHISEKPENATTDKIEENDFE